uniref:hypothetical protein n=1 Tax=Paractinoplanes polyasparticus TaxID=2856853 RepID=UPI001C857916|nr:hypothetical protein [Actinoplanes polyasparticus]
MAHDRAKRSNQPRLRTGYPIPKSLRAALVARSEGWCEIATLTCTGTATDLAHRKKVGAGGRKGEAAKAHHVLSNALAACRACHGRGHLMPAEAYRNGWMLREHQNPLKEPVLRRGRWVLLDDSGSIEPTTKED